MTDVLVIAGLSGAGRSQAADDIEDLGWFVIDNLPTSLVEKVVELASSPLDPHSQLALVVGNVSQQSDMLEVLRNLRHNGHRVTVLFLDSSTSELVKRYGATRRRHPLDHDNTSSDPGHSGGIAALIEKERALLEPVKAVADLVIDTSALTVHQLKAKLVEIFSDQGKTDAIQVGLVSFGFKQGLPLDVDLVFDVRFLPNPYWDENLRPLTGIDADVSTYVLANPIAEQFLSHLEGMLELLLPAYVAEGKSYLSIAIGCTGGQHRSVAMVERLSQWFTDRAMHPRVTHRDLPRH
ncbi:MAG: RNase adapter RapZ [Ilumatobacteraceae bacterium]|nr:RNase adapter RapZ [Ilumatobacteraceae bacterium]